MKKIFAFLVILMVATSCSKRDPILPGVRHDIFDTTEIKVENKDVPELSQNAKDIFGDSNCDYKQDALKMFDKFVKDFLQNRDITHYLNRQFEVRFSPDFVKTLQEQAEMGYDLMAKSKRKDEDVEETLFFWPLKNGLYEASKL